MTDELKKDLEEGMRKFIFTEPNKARYEIRKELHKILKNHEIQVEDIIIAQAGGRMSVDILFGGRRFVCKFNSKPIEFSEISKSFSE